MIEGIVRSFVERGCLVDPEAVAFLARQVDPEAYVRALLTRAAELPLHLTLAGLEDPNVVVQEVTRPDPLLPGARLPTADLVATHRALEPLRLDRSILARDFSAEVEVVRNTSEASTSRGQVEDFLHYFNHRFETLSKLLRKRREVAQPVPVARAFQSGKDVQIIGLVEEIKTTPNGHALIEVEDPTGSVTVLCHKSTEGLAQEAQTLMPDEIVGVVASPAKDGSLLIARQLVRPDIPLHRPAREAAPPILAAFMSDIHVGSRTFLDGRFQKAVWWFKGNEGNERERETARRVKYLVLSGDVVDGIGIFPDQEASLRTVEILKQYEELAGLLEGLPDSVHVVVQPGNHDAVRPTEPQPPLGREIQKIFSRLEATFVSNPATFRLHGAEVLSYHGFSMIDFATRVAGLSMERPLEIMRHMLKCRHLAPTYGGNTPLSPEERDALVIESVPDIFVTGHLHVSGIESYRGVTLVNGGTWQDQTDYQKMLNLVPTPARMPVVDLSTFTGNQVDFAS